MSKRKVLIVEDQAGFREFVDITLTKLGFEVFTAITGNVALKRAKEHNPDIILLDMMLPDIDGYEVCRRLREQPETTMTPIIFVSAVSSDKHIERAMAAGASDYLVKPLSTAELKSLIYQYLGEE